MNSQERAILELMSTGVSPANAQAVAAETTNKAKTTWYALARKSGIGHTQALNMTRTGANFTRNLKELGTSTRGMRNRAERLVDYMTYRAAGFNHRTALTSAISSYY
jgi:hypothetical protein